MFWWQHVDSLAARGVGVNFKCRLSSVLIFLVQLEPVINQGLFKHQFVAKIQLQDGRPEKTISHVLPSREPWPGQDPGDVEELSLKKMQQKVVRVESLKGKRVKTTWPPPAGPPDKWCKTALDSADYASINA